MCFHNIFVSFLSFSTYCKLLFSALTPALPPFLLSFYCTQWLFIIQTALPFHFHGTKSLLHSSKIGSGEWRGWEGDAALVTVPNTARLPVAEKESLRKAGGMFCFFPPLRMIKANVSQTWRASPKWLFKECSKSLKQMHRSVVKAELFIQRHIKAVKNRHYDNISDNISEASETSTNCNCNLSFILI